MPAAPDTLQPFRVAVPDTELEQLRRRLADARWPDAETVGDWSQGVPLAVLHDLCDHWRSAYDWRSTEERLNRRTQYRTVADGVPIHLFHLPSPRRQPVPARRADPGRLPVPRPGVASGRPERRLGEAREQRDHRPGRQDPRRADSARGDHLYAEVDLAAVRAARRLFDPVGHDNRPDIFQLRVDNRPRSAVVVKSPMQSPEPLSRMTRTTR